MMTYLNEPRVSACAMTNFFHPPLDEKVLDQIEVVRQLMLEHASYFINSPYSGKIEKRLRGWLKSAGVTGRGEGLLEGMGDNFDDGSVDQKMVQMELDRAKTGWNYLYDESVTLYAKLKTAGSSLDEADKMAYYRTSTSLLEKLITMQERSLGLKQVSEHHATVLRIMENVLSPVQRNEVMEQLEAALNQGA